jgi:hypothetical protein
MNKLSGCVTGCGINQQGLLWLVSRRLGNLHIEPVCTSVSGPEPDLQSHTTTGIINATLDSVRRPGSRFLLRYEAVAVVAEL